jgi:hypothetical protein
MMMLRTAEQHETRQEAMRSANENRATTADGPAFERHYTVRELAKVWNLSYETVRHIVMQQGEVCKIGLPGKRKTYRIAESVARRIHARLLAG